MSRFHLRESVCGLDMVVDTRRYNVDRQVCDRLMKSNRVLAGLGCGGSRVGKNHAKAWAM